MSLVFSVEFTSSLVNTLIADDFESALNYACDGINCGCSNVLIITTFLFRGNLKQLFLKIQENYDECKAVRIGTGKSKTKSFSLSFIPVKDDDCIKYLERDNLTSQRVTTILNKYLVLGVATAYSLAGVIIVAYNYYQDGHIDLEKLFYPYPLL